MGAFSDIANSPFWKVTRALSNPVAAGAAAYPYLFGGDKEELAPPPPPPPPSTTGGFVGGQQPAPRTAFQAPQELPGSSADQFVGPPAFVGPPYNPGAPYSVEDEFVGPLHPWAAYPEGYQFVGPEQTDMASGPKQVPDAQLPDDPVAQDIMKDLPDSGYRPTEQEIENMAYRAAPILVDPKDYIDKLYPSTESQDRVIAKMKNLPRRDVLKMSKDEKSRFLLDLGLGMLAGSNRPNTASIFGKAALGAMQNMDQQRESLREEELKILNEELKGASEKDRQTFKARANDIQRQFRADLANATNGRIAAEGAANRRVQMHNVAQQIQSRKDINADNRYAAALANQQRYTSELYQAQLKSAEDSGKSSAQINAIKALNKEREDRLGNIKSSMYRDGDPNQPTEAWSSWLEAGKTEKEFIAEQDYKGWVELLSVGEGTDPARRVAMEVMPQLRNTHLKTGTPDQQAQWNKYIEQVRRAITQDKGFQEMDPPSQKMLLHHLTKQKVGSTP